MEYEKLDNGITVIVDNNQESLSTACVFQFFVGAKDEQNHRGVAHFLEHILFAGTTSKSKEEIRKLFQDNGCYFNASTNLLKTKFYIKTINEYFFNAFRILADVISNPLFDNNMIDTEKKIIKDEILKNNENDINFYVEQQRTRIFRSTHLEKYVLGTIEDIDKITKKILQDFYYKNYVTGNLVIAFSGKITKTQALALVQHYIHLPMQHRENHNIENVLVTKDLTLIPKKTQQATVCIFMQGYGAYNDSYFAYQLVVAIIGGNIYSRLFQKIREEMGLVYHIQTFTENYLTFGFWGISFSCEIGNVKKVLMAISQTLKEIIDKKLITDQELEQAKKDYKVSLITGLETSSSRANFLATQFWNKNYLTNIYQNVEMIEKVSIHQIRQVSKNLLEAIQMNALIVGGDFQKEEFDFL